MRSVNTGYGDNTQFHRDLDRLMAQLNDAVRSFHGAGRSSDTPSGGAGTRPDRYGWTMIRLFRLQVRPEGRAASRAVSPGCFRHGGRRLAAHPRLRCLTRLRRAWMPSRLPRHHAVERPLEPHLPVRGVPVARSGSRCFSAQRSSPPVPRPIPNSTPSPRCPARPCPAPRRSSPCTRSASPATSSATQIVQTSEDYRVVLRGTDWWAEPLDAMLTRVLAQDLTERLPQTTVYTSAGAVTGSPEATVEVELSRLDLDRSGNLLLIGQAFGFLQVRARRPTPAACGSRSHCPRPASKVRSRQPARRSRRSPIEIATMLAAAPGRR